MLHIFNGTEAGSDRPALESSQRDQRGGSRGRGGRLGRQGVQSHGPGRLSWQLAHQSWQLVLVPADLESSSKSQI